MFANLKSRFEEAVSEDSEQDAIACVTEAHDSGLLSDLLETEFPLFREFKIPILICALRGWSELLDLLRKKGIDLGQKCSRTGDTILHLAARSGESNIIRHFVQSNSILDVNVINYDSYTPIFFACEWKNLATVKTLVELGADLNMRDTLGHTALHMCLGSPEIMKYLIEKGLSASALDIYGNTPLHKMLAFFGQSPEATRVLIELGAANVNARNSEGHTPLHAWLIELPNINIYALECVEILIEHGANVYLRDRRDKDVFDSMSGSERSEYAEIKPVLDRANLAKLRGLYQSLCNSSESELAEAVANFTQNISNPNASVFVDETHLRAIEVLDFELLNDIKADELSLFLVYFLGEEFQIKMLQDLRNGLEDKRLQLEVDLANDDDKHGSQTTHASLISMISIQLTHIENFHNAISSTAIKKRIIDMARGFHTRNSAVLEGQLRVVKFSVNKVATSENNNTLREFDLIFSDVESIDQWFKLYS